MIFHGFSANPMVTSYTFSTYSSCSTRSKELIKYTGQGFKICSLIDKKAGSPTTEYLSYKITGRSKIYSLRAQIRRCNANYSVIKNSEIQVETQIWCCKLTSMYEPILCNKMCIPITMLIKLQMIKITSLLCLLSWLQKASVASKSCWKYFLQIKTHFIRKNLSITC